jgi:hypothetical protein
MDASPISSRLDPDRSTFITVFGKKGEGKSVLARRMWDTWPHDQCCIDINADALDAGDVDHTYTGEVPDFWPAPRREDEPVRIRYVPELRSSTYQDDLDRAVGLALKRPHSLLWVDEVGVLSRANRTGPHTRRLLHHGRHLKISSLCCGPRPIDIDPLVIAQSDVVYVFKLPNPADRRRVADVCGVDPKTMDDAVHALGPHEYLRFDGNELVHFPPLPMERARRPVT